ncbi:MAG: 1-deoxy-D-xylulose-5-phosphate reductoisomerase [Bacteroidales bacterium]|nr:1-deoxy-D-xylulose-5-phosphate reductoisomerase [Bacteroidales bacterium]
MKSIAILGSTGSIGTQTLNVVRRHKDMFSVEVLVAGSNADLLVQQALEFDPNAVVIADASRYSQVQEALQHTDTKVFAGMSSACDLMEMGSIDIVVAAIVGFAGLRPTMRAIEHGHTIALANKETLVVAGQLVTRAAMQHNAAILPVDSEHSAIFQCLEAGNEIDKILLTASGGPFFGRTREELQQVRLDEALNHPNWKMGRKVTIDSATLMNKGLEVIEAKWLFGVEPEKIEVLVHPQSIVHSMVQFQDGSIKAQLGTPTMETPIQLALTYPQRVESHLPRFSFLDHPQLTFHKPDTHTFRCLQLAYDAIRQGGNMPCIMNAANEVAVQRFIDGKIGFLQIADCVADAMAKGTYVKDPSFEDLIETDKEIRR